MRLTKIQKFLKEHDIDYVVETNTVKGNGFADIKIKSEKTHFTAISEISGNTGTSVSGIMLFYKNKDSHSSYSVVLTSQDEIIRRIKDDISKI